MLTIFWHRFILHIVVVWTFGKHNLKRSLYISDLFFTFLKKDIQWEILIFYLLYFTILYFAFNESNENTLFLPFEALFLRTSLIYSSDSKIVSMCFVNLWWNSMLISLYSYCSKPIYNDLPIFIAFCHTSLAYIGRYFSFFKVFYVNQQTSIYFNKYIH